MHICILMIDALRPDHLGCYGSNKETSPHTDAIAQKSVLFENAFAQGNWTVSSVNSMLTGRYPSVNQVEWFDQRANSKFVSFPELLAKRQFSTTIFSPFEVLLSHDGISSYFNEKKFLKLGKDSPAVFRQWVQTQQHSFQLFHVGEYVHEPFCAAKKYVDPFLDAELRSEEEKIIKKLRPLLEEGTDPLGDSLREIMRHINRGGLKVTPREFDYLRACYNAGIFYVDKYIGEFHKILQEESDDYIFILTSDHGQAFFEHNYLGHGSHLYDEVTRVPLIIDYNGKWQHRVTDVVQLMDIYPTLVELLSLPDTPPLDGASFSHLMEGRSHGAEERIALAEAYPFVSIRNKDYKLVSSYSKFWDSREISNRFDQHAYRKSWRRNLLSKWLRFYPDRLYDTRVDKHERKSIRWQKKKEHGKLRQRLGRILSESLTATAPPVTISLDRKMEQQLKDLGYL